MKVAGIVFAGVLAVAGVGFGAGSMYVIDEGNIGVITSMGQAVRQEGPSGLQFRVPIVNGVEEFDVRERALPIQLSGATFDQMTVALDVSINWQPDSGRVLEIFQKYGSMEAFAANTITPRLRQSLKASVGQYTGARMIRERQAVADAMLETARSVLESYPALINSVQVENFQLPGQYMEAVLNTQAAAEAAKKAEQDLERQRFESQQEVNTADAAREAEEKRADGAAYATRIASVAEAERINAIANAEANSIRLRGDAEAEAIAAVQKALSDSTLYVDLIRAKNWNGQMPTTVLGDTPSVLMQVPTP